MEFTIFAPPPPSPPANMDNFDANVQIYDTAKYLEIYCFCSSANTIKLHAKVLFWYPGQAIANTTAN